jgi:hypothetical protein
MKKAISQQPPMLRPVLLANVLGALWCDCHETAARECSG